MEKVLKNIRNNNIKSAIGLLFPTIALTGGFILILYFMITEPDDFHIGYLLILASFGLFGYFSDKAFIRAIQLIIDPMKDDVFKKYGSPKKIAKIIEEIENSKIYEDKHLIISQNYISDKKDYSKIVLCNDVLGVHKLVHKTNYVIDYYQIVITDKYNQTTTYQYGRNEEEKVNELLIVIGSKCPNAELGYTKKEWEHIKENSVALPDEIMDDNENNDDFENEMFKCDNCGALVKESDTKCPHCGEKFEDDAEDEQEETKKEKTSDMDKKYSDLTKLKKLLDKKIISQEEFDKEKEKILNNKN